MRRLFAWLGLLLEFLGLLKKAGKLAAGDEPKAPPQSGPPRDPTDKDNKFHLNQ